MKLTSKKRNSLPSSDFAEPGMRKYPIEDKNHAKNALARVAQHGSPEEKATIKRKVKKKFPSIKVKATKSKSKRTDARKRV